MGKGVFMTPTIETTIQNIKLLSPASYKKASGYIESLLRADNAKANTKYVPDSIFEEQIDTLFDEYDEAFSVLAK